MGTRFETDGYLSDELSHSESRIADQYYGQLDLAKQVNRIAHDIIGTVQIDREELHSNLMGTLLTRQIEAFQAFMILIGKGLLFQAQIILRNIAESMFIVGAISKSPTFAEDFIERDALSSLRLAKGLRKFLVRSGGDIPDTLKRLIEKLEDKAKGGKGRKNKWRTIQPFKVEDIAKIAQMEDFYDTVYRHTSLVVHTSPLSLNEVFIVGRNGKVEGLNYQPKVDGLEKWLFSATEMTLYTLYETANHFSLESSQRRIDEVKQEFKAQVDNYNPSPSFH